MKDRDAIVYEWMGHIQDALREQDGKLDRIIKLLEGDARNAEILRADHRTLARQVSEHERKLAIR